MKIEEVVPWGRSFGEYCRMFALTGDELSGRILGCGDGPASFNAEATARGIRVTSTDPLYQFAEREIRARIAATYDLVLERTRYKRDTFVWNEIESIDTLGRVRMAAMERFLEDYEAGKRERRYVDAALPELPFTDASFDLALCSHLLFLYSEQLSEEFHRQAVAEMCRVAREVRIFPLLTMDGEPSPNVRTVIEAAERAGWQARVEQVPYEFQRGGNQMLRIRWPG